VTNVKGLHLIEPTINHEPARLDKVHKCLRLAGNDGILTIGDWVACYNAANIRRSLLIGEDCSAGKAIEPYIILRRERESPIIPAGLYVAFSVL
jgi:hypothetical protein